MCVPGPSICADESDGGMAAMIHLETLFKFLKAGSLFLYMQLQEYANAGFLDFS